MAMDKDIGTVTKGKYADLLVLDGDPLKDIEVLRRQECIKMVMKGGVSAVDRLPVKEPAPVR